MKSEVETEIIIEELNETNGKKTDSNTVCFGDALDSRDKTFREPFGGEGDNALVGVSMKEHDKESHKGLEYRQEAVTAYQVNSEMREPAALGADTGACGREQRGSESDVGTRGKFVAVGRAE